MAIRYTCPHCNRTTDIADQYAGQTGPCAGCGQTITIPVPDGVSPFSGALPKRGLSGWAIALIVVASAVPVILVCGGILLALLLPAVQAARESARRMQCTNNLKQIGLALFNYEQANKCFPPAYLADKDGKPMHSWRVLILPYLEQNDLYEEYRFDEPWDSPHNKALAARMPSVYQCPNDAKPGDTQSSYAMIVGPHAISDGPTARHISEVRDGLSNTILVAEAARAGINWMEPRDLNTEEMTYCIWQSGDESGKSMKNDVSSSHSGVANVVFGDGSVRSLSAMIDPDKLEALMTIDGGEKASID